MFCSSLLVLLLLICITTSFSFQKTHVPTIPLKQRFEGVTFSAFALKAKKEEKPIGESEYWQGEWVCADCGYVYDKDIDGGGLYFEQQKKGFICPQCSAPRKRYAKKVGDQWGVTNGMLSLIIASFLFSNVAFQ